jgi:hypothetical protein
MTPTEARALADNLNPFEEAADVIRSLADQIDNLHAAYGQSQQMFLDAAYRVEALQGQVLSSVEREEYFAMKRDAERYRWLRENASWDQRRTILQDTNEEIDAAIDRAREAT